MDRNFKFIAKVADGTTLFNHPIEPAFIAIHPNNQPVKISLSGQITKLTATEIKKI